MNNIADLLDRAAGPTAAPVHADADLERGHRALARTRRRRGALALVGVAVAGVAGVVGVARYTGPDQGPTRAQESQHPAGIRLLVQPLEAGPYTFDATPEGWEVQGVTPEAVTIAPVGFPDQEPLSFAGKLVILFDGNRPSGDQVDLDGRTFWVREGQGYTTIATRTRAGEPEGVVSIQYPSGTGWTRDTMLAFLAGVHLGAGAQQGVG